MSSLKDRRDLYLMRQVMEVRYTIKNWYLHAATKYMLSRNFSDHDEKLLEEITDFFLDNLENIERIEKEIYDKKNSD